MVIDDAILGLIEFALKITLTADQRAWLKNEPASHKYYDDRATGKTLAHCIKNALGDETIDTRKMHMYSDRFELPYSHGYYKNLFRQTWEKLSSAGLPVTTVLGMNGNPITYKVDPLIEQKLRSWLDENKQKTNNTTDQESTTEKDSTSEDQTTR